MNFPRFEIQTAIRDARCYSRSEKAVLNAIASRADATGVCWPDYETLASDTSYSRAAVAAALAALQRRTDGPLRLLVQHQGRRDGSGGRGSNLYRLELSPEPGCKPVESIAQTQGALESNPETQPKAAIRGLSPKITGVESKKTELESKEWTGSSPKKPSKKPSKESTRPEVIAVFEFWRADTGHGDAKLDDKRAKRIAARLRDRFSVEQLKTAIAHRRNDPWLMGETDRSERIFDGIETLLRDRAQVERLVSLTKRREPGQRRGPQRLPEPQRGVPDESQASTWGKGDDSPLAKASGDRD